MVGVTPTLAALRGAHGPCPPDHNKKPDARIYFRYSAVVSKWPVTRPPAEYEKAKCGMVCYGELNIIMPPLKGYKSLTHVCYCLCAIVLVHICPNHFSVALLLRRQLLIYEKTQGRLVPSHRRVGTRHAQFSEPTSLARPIASSGEQF